MTISKKANVKKCVVVKTRSNNNWGWEDGRTRFSELFVRVEVYESDYHAKPPRIVITKGSYDGPIVLCMDLVDWAVVSELFDEHVLEVTGEALANL